MTGSDRFSLWVLNFQFMAHRFGSGELFDHPTLTYADTPYWHEKPATMGGYIRSISFFLWLFISA
jgi:hypothetical protein